MVVGTAHRVGSTWLYARLKDLGGYRDGAHELPATMIRHGLIDLNQAEAGALLWGLSGAIIKTHTCPLPVDAASAAAIVSVYRDPPDVLVSAAHHMARLPPERGGWAPSSRDATVPERIRMLITSERARFLSELEWWFHTPCALHLQYERLLAAPAAELRLAADYLQVDVDDRQLAECAARHSFRAQTGRDPGEEDISDVRRKGHCR
jgi:hypothetical protein